MRTSGHRFRIRCPYCKNIVDKTIRATSREDADRIFWEEYDANHGPGICNEETE